MSEFAAELGAERYSQWVDYLHGVVAAVERGRQIPLGPSSEPPVPPAVLEKPVGGARVLYCSPHPDDETLSGALALRFRLEAGESVKNVAITLGSGAAQYERRRAELTSACQVLGFELEIASMSDVEPADGLAPINLKTRASDPAGWAARVERLAEIFDREEPEAVFTPHAEDFNGTHIGTHHLVIEALDLYLAKRSWAAVMLIETEFWHELADPNLMVAVTPELAAIQLVAAGEHGGEMLRNPYHLLHPCRLMNNVRRGSEVVGGQGAAVQPFVFAELYRVSFRRPTGAHAPKPGGHMLGPYEIANLAALRRMFEPERPADEDSGTELHG